jgi:hypothetical protein
VTLGSVRAFPASDGRSVDLYPISLHKITIPNIIPQEKSDTDRVLHEKIAIDLSGLEGTDELIAYLFFICLDDI